MSTVPPLLKEGEGDPGYIPREGLGGAGVT